MRKMILTLPVAAFLLATGALFSELGGAFAGSAPVSVSPEATVETAAAPHPAQPCWNETAGRPNSGK